VHPLDRNNCNHFLNSQNKSGLTQNIYHIQAFKPAFEVVGGAYHQITQGIVLLIE
jgi:hypothetical protein